MNLITDNSPCPNAEGTNAKHVVKLQSYGCCILCGKKVGPDVGPIKIPLTVKHPDDCWNMGCICKTTKKED